MDQIARFLKRFATFEVPEKAILRAATRAIQTSIGIEVDVKDLKLNAGTLSVRGNSMLRSEIFRKKNEILRGIEDELGKSSVKDIV